MLCGCVCPKAWQDALGEAHSGCAPRTLSQVVGHAVAGLLFEQSLVPHSEAWAAGHEKPRRGRPHGQMCALRADASCTQCRLSAVQCTWDGWTGRQAAFVVRVDGARQTGTRYIRGRDGSSSSVGPDAGCIRWTVCTSTLCALSALVCELMDRLWHEGPQVQSTRADRQVDLMLQGHARMVGGASRPDMCCWRSCLYDSETLAVKRAIPVFL